MSTVWIVPEKIRCMLAISLHSACNLILDTSPSAPNFNHVVNESCQTHVFYEWFITRNYIKRGLKCSAPWVTQLSEDLLRPQDCFQQPFDKLLHLLYLIYNQRNIQLWNYQPGEPSQRSDWSNLTFRHHYKNVLRSKDQIPLPSDI